MGICVFVEYSGLEPHKEPLGGLEPGIFSLMEPLGGLEPPICDLKDLTEIETIGNYRIHL